MALTASLATYSAPTVTIRESLHEQYLCTVSVDQQAAEDLVTAYRQTLEAAGLDPDRLNPEFIAKLAEPFLESSINRARQYIEYLPTGSRAPLLSDATSFTPAERDALRVHEDPLKEAIARYEEVAGNEPVREAFRQCVTELKSRGVKEGLQPVPPVEVPVAPVRGGSSQQGLIIAGVVTALLAVVGAGVFAVNSGLVKLPPFRVPALPLG